MKLFYIISRKRIKFSFFKNFNLKKMSEEQNKKKHTIDEVVEMYARQTENEMSGKVSPANKVPQTSVQDSLAEQAQEMIDNKLSAAEIKELRNEEIRKETLSMGTGFMNIPMKDLPSGGIFYPDGTKIFVRAATGGDIRHWSMIDEKELQEIDEGLNYIIERCVQISFPAESGKMATWKDLKEIDRFYLILCIRDFTFTEGHNELKIKVSENKEVVVHKDNLSFIDISEGMMKYYNPSKKCFTFQGKTPSVGELNFYFPSVGTTQWLKDYIKRKSQRQEAFDQDFIKIAPMLINDYRNLNDKTYGELVFASMGWGVYEWSIVSNVKKAIEKAISPKMIYNDEEGAEKETPLNFCGGIKSLFTYNLAEELGL